MPAPILVLVGTAGGRGPRTIVWCAVAGLHVGSAIRAGRRGGTSDAEWTIGPVHFVERHSLFVIISLGEVLVAVGVAASETRLDSTIGLGVIAAVSVACVFWWTYFSYVPGVIETVLRESANRGRVARNLFSFGHFPIIVGIVLYAVAAKHVVAHPSDDGTADLVALAISVAAFLGGFLGLQWQAPGLLRRPRGLGERTGRRAVETVLTPRFVDHDAHRVREVEAPVVRPHRDVQPTVVRECVQPVRAEARRLASEHDDVTRCVGDRVVPAMRRPGGGREPARRDPDPRPTFVPRIPDPSGSQFVIVQTGSAQRTIVHLESEWTHQMQPRADVGAESHDVPGVRRDLGGHQHHVEHRGSVGPNATRNPSGIRPGG